MVVWITGLPGAGKTTISNALLGSLRNAGKQSVLLDGDKLREAFQQNSYDIESRQKLAFSYARFAKMLSEQGSIVICATVSMFHAVREWNATHIEDYFEVYISVSDEVLRQRNQKSLYSGAESGQVKHVHGYDIAVELPENPHLTITNDGGEAPDSIADKIIEGMNL